VLVNDVVNTPLFDRSINPYPPGSTVKPFIGMAGLQHELVDYEFAIQDPGYFRLPGVSYRWGDYTLRTGHRWWPRPYRPEKSDLSILRYVFL
jgi:penicillin-binding protein 2